MPKKKKPSSSRPSAQAPTPRAQSSPAKPAAEGRGARKRGRSGAIVAIVALAIAAIGALVYFFRSEPAQVSSTPSTAVASASAANYVGSEACGGCHVNERNAWRGSDHDLAMQVADEKTVLADFANAKFTYAGTTSTFSRRDGHFFVNTDGPDGKLNDYQIKYTFGVRPLQQYLIEFPGGRLQALGIAWDSRSKADGGQRWFHLYPKQNIKAGDWLHWTAAGQNWNFMCAECHSTDLRKNFDAATNAFNTTWKELDVACEACHGPGSDHVAWARDPAKAKGANKGLALALDERRGVTWSPLPNGNSQRSAPRSTAREIEMCARCHGRAARISDDYVYGAPPLDSRRLALLDDGLYWNDGQMRDEVYNWGSFVQSKMFAAGVTCSDCHDPHSLKLRQPGNAVCGQCHQPQKYDSEAHTHHAAGTPGAACAACHMPTTTYMVVDPRHDHSMRIPRPDLSVKLDVPNACNQCHTAKSPQWAADAIREWHGKTPIGYQNFANALRAGSVGAPGARGALLTLIDDPKQPAIVRASAIERLGHWLTPTLMASVSRSLNDPDPLVRLAAVEALANADVQTRLRYLPRMVSDSVRAVRIEAARGLAGEPEASLTQEQQAPFARALAEYIAVQNYNADRPEGHLNLGNLFVSRNKGEEAIAEFRKALAIDPTFIPAYANLADLYRARGSNGEAETLLRQGIAKAPNSAALHHALGLTLVRQQRHDDARKELAEAVRLEPDDARYAYVYGVALNDGGKPKQALQAMQAALERNPYSRDLLAGLSHYYLQWGDADAARKSVNRLLELDPENPEYRELEAKLTGQPR